MSDLLPWHATPFEKAFSRASDPAVRLDTPITISRGIKYIGTPPPWLPFLIYEYGLGELSPYVPNLYQLIDDGIRWQRVRGTPAAIARGLGWLGYSGAIEEAEIRRTRFGGAWTDGADVPLNEESERYEVDILNGGNVVSTIAVTQPAASYPAAWQIADFGALQASVSLRVYQLSAAVGRGWPGAAII